MGFKIQKIGFHGISWDLRSKNWGFMGFIADENDGEVDV